MLRIIFNTFSEINYNHYRLILSTLIFLIYFICHVNKINSQEIHRVDGISPTTIITRDHAVIASGTVGRIISQLPAAGSFVKKGDLLIEFDCRYSNDEAMALAQEIDKLQQTYGTVAEPDSRISGRAKDSDAVRKERKVAEFALKQTKLRIELCTIRAPFDGTITRVIPPPNEIVAVGQPLLEIAGERRIEIEVVVKAAIGTSLTVGQEILVRVAGSRTEVPAVVTGITEVGSMAPLLITKARLKGFDPRLVPDVVGAPLFGGQ